MNLFDRNVVDFGLRRAQILKNCEGGVLSSFGDSLRLPNDLPNLSQSSPMTVRAMLMAVRMGRGRPFGRLGAGSRLRLLTPTLMAVLMFMAITMR